MTTLPRAARKQHDPLDRDYYQAVADDGMLEREKLLKRVAEAAAGSDASNEQLRRGIERMRQTAARTEAEDASVRLQAAILSPAFWKVPNRLHR